MGKQKTQAIVYGVFAAIFGVLTIVFAALTFLFMGQEQFFLFIVLDILFGIFFIAFLIYTIVFIKYYKTFMQNKANPNTIANLVTRDGTKYTHFAVVPDAEKQKKDRAVTNAIGVATLLFFRVGYFTYNKITTDIFVSDDDIYVNQPKNYGFDDSKFNRIAASDIASLYIQSVKNNERVTITLTDNRGVLSYDIATKNADPQRIRNAFAAITANAAQNAPQSFATAQHSVFCTNCGAQIEAGTAFCTKCGHKQTDTASENTTGNAQ